MPAYHLLQAGKTKPSIAICNEALGGAGSVQTLLGIQTAVVSLGQPESPRLWVAEDISWRSESQVSRE